MDIKSRKGTAMVEAAVICPLVVAAVIAVICMASGLYSSLALQTALHMDLRKECGEISKTVYRMEEMRDYQSVRDWAGIRPVVRMEEEREYNVLSLFRHSMTRKERGRSYIIDEAELIRIVSSAGESL